MQVQCPHCLEKVPVTPPPDAADRFIRPCPACGRRFTVRCPPRPTAPPRVVASATAAAPPAAGSGGGPPAGLPNGPPVQPPAPGEAAPVPAGATAAPGELPAFWHVRKPDGTLLTFYSQRNLLTWIAAGVISGEDLVWRQGENWQRVDEAPAFRAQLAAQPRPARTGPGLGDGAGLAERTPGTRLPTQPAVPAGRVPAVADAFARRITASMDDAVVLDDLDIGSPPGTIDDPVAPDADGVSPESELPRWAAVVGVVLALALSAFFALAPHFLGRATP